MLSMFLYMVSSLLFLKEFLACCTAVSHVVDRANIVPLIDSCSGQFYCNHFQFDCNFFINSFHLDLRP